MSTPSHEPATPTNIRRRSNPVGERGPCPNPNCDSRKDCQLYDDGHQFCFKCGERFSPTDSDLNEHSRTPLAKRQPEDVETIWRNARRVLGYGHGYLRRKGCLTGHGLRIRRNTLLVPIRRLDGRLVSIQKIGPRGNKRYARGCELADGFFAVGKPGMKIFICEGVATALTIYEAIEAYTIAAMSAGRMERVARVIREAYPNADITICADNDND